MNRLGPRRALDLALYALVADGLVAVYLGDLLGPLGILLVGGAAIGSVWQARLRAPLARIRGGATLPGLVAAALALVDIVYLAATILDGLIHLLLFLLLYRLYTRETLRDARDISFICFFMLVAAAPGTFDVGFLFVFIAFLLGGTALLMLRHVLSEAERVPPDGGLVAAAPILGRHVFTLSVVAAIATLVITATLFFVIPRIGQAAMPLRAKLGRMVSGFSERVNLGSFGEIETDTSVVMRVHVPEGIPSPENLPNVRWRGIALDHFDGRTWTRDDPDRYLLRRTPSGTFDLGRPRGGLLFAQEIYLEPIGSEVVFGAPRILRVALRADHVTVDSAGSVAVASAAARLRYVVESELEGLSPRRATSRREVLDEDDRQRYLQLPALAPRVPALAREATAGASEPFEVATRLTNHLATQFRYTRALERTTELSPVEEFLFVSRAGNCEYFAASLAVMLRALGIPARVVNGFQRGEWNAYGRYFMVRLLDAHSWVEAWIDDVGWVTFDPSPRADVAATAAPGPVNLYLDSLRLSWYRYVVNWSFTDQAQAASDVRRAARSWTPSFDPARWREAQRPAMIAVATVAVVIVLALMLRHVRRGATPAARALPRFYERALRALARRQLVPEAGETAREFHGRVVGVEPALTVALAAITGGYERVRFGGALLAPDEVRRLESLADALMPSSGRVTTPLMRNDPSSRTSS
jgi:transglutaminase-like putative cysteine protease